MLPFVSSLPRLLASPVLHMVQNDRSRIIRRVLPAEGLNKVAVGVHEVEVYAVIHEVVLARFDVLWRAEIYAIRLTHGFDLVVRAC